MKNDVHQEAPANLANPLLTYFTTTSKLRLWFLWATTAGFLAGWVMGALVGPAAVNRETKLAQATAMALLPPMIALR